MANLITALILLPVAGAQDTQGIVATSRIVAFTFATATSKLLTDWGPGDYLMRIYFPGATSPSRWSMSGYGTNRPWGLR